MEQYIEIKAANPDCLLFYRMGDFYELFFEDAEVASRALGIVLTKRGKHQGQDIPMCGVPVHAAQDYLRKLIASGHRVAICEQVEDPKVAKGIVRREVVETVTPGAIFADDLLDVSRWASDAVVLALPNKILCRPDCAGLCPVCGRDLNEEPHEHEEEHVDPRWAALEQLREQL